MVSVFSKITVVTPNYNQSDYLEQTIQSVLNQKYPNLEYIVIDGGSTDGSLEIIEKYENHLSYWISEPDNGMYDAINKGFSKSSGEIMCWINSDDVLLPGSLMNMQKLFNDCQYVDWIQGLNGFIDLNGQLINMSYAKKFCKLNFLMGDFKWIQQESTFWRRSLWEECGSYVNDDLKLAGDFELWFRFFQKTRLYYARIPIGGWRKRKEQLSSSQIDNYLLEVENVINLHKLNTKEQLILNKIKNYNRYLNWANKLKIIRTDIFKRKKTKLMNLNNIEIVYSYKNNKFIAK